MGKRLSPIEPKQLAVMQNLRYVVCKVLKEADGPLDEHTGTGSRTTEQRSAPRVERPPAMKISLPDIIQNSNKGLESVPTGTLRKCLKPILNGLSALDAEDFLSLERDPENQGPCIGKDAFVRPIHDMVTPSCDEGTVRYVHLSEVEGQYSMGIFVFPPNSRIPLHDHPGMCVLSRVLYGDLRRQGLDLAREQNEEEVESDDDGSPSIASWLTWSKARISAKRARGKKSLRPKGSKLAYRKQVDHLVAPACTMLFPFEGNLHEFVAGPAGAAVLDVLLPPYDHDHHRDCTFYNIQENSEAEQHDTSLDPVWIVPTDQPEDFHCISGCYAQLESSD